MLDTEVLVTSSVCPLTAGSSLSRTQNLQQGHWTVSEENRPFWPMLPVCDLGILSARVHRTARVSEVQVEEARPLITWAKAA